MAYSIFPDCPASILCLFYGEVCIRIGERGPGRRLIQYISVAKSKHPGWIYKLWKCGRKWIGVVWDQLVYEMEASTLGRGVGWGSLGGGEGFMERAHILRGGTQRKIWTLGKRNIRQILFEQGTHQWNVTLCILTRLHSDVTFGQESLICVKILPFRVPVKFFSFWWSGTLKTICWTPPVNIDGSITGVEKRKHFAGGVNKQTTNLYECLHQPLSVFFYCFFLLISNNHNFQWILQNIDLGLWINDIFEWRVPFCGAYGSWWQIMAGQFCRQSTHRRLLKLQIQIQKINKEKYKVQSYDMAISKGWRNIWSINELELKYAFAMTLSPFAGFFL